jgi:AcrR family transcriptional regulator
MRSQSAPENGSVPGSRGRGRPALVEVRVDKLVSTFLDLVGTKGLEATSLTDVSEASGISRTAIRHFVGNRESLIAAAITHVCASYSTSLRSAVGDDPLPEDLIRFLFSPAWTDPFSPRARAFDALLNEGSHDLQLSSQMRSAYEEVIDLLVTSFRRHSPPGPTKRQYAAVAYSIVCLSESHGDMRTIGFDESYARFALTGALALVAGLDRFRR